ncbi:Uma2 family endonuclease [Amycolatopsis alkalitolerans]|uniref:Uma2 family endonuclease n=1 Tax=Amycolatopsis alkalitolerans TaxID=2547244 RepID=A0A5C4M143_9PSEU|nr:Uma2 family endonuclease [Amycolatopsis alkalitolerans]TNC24425.1 Uma2 family endonuclease [Amycolatopsis alkalitolerans]
MTALPQPQVDGEPHLLTVAEYAALGEIEPGYTELQEGHLLMSPSPRPAHNIASLQLAFQLATQIPEKYGVIQAIDIDLQLVPPDQPGFSRRPDLIVADRNGVDRAERNGTLIRAEDVLIVIEIVSPSSHRMDTVVKHGEYADSGIRYYWIVDLEPPVSLVACHLAGEFGYQDAPADAHTFTTKEPFPIELELDRLRG